MSDIDPEMERIRAIKAAQMRYGIGKKEAGMEVTVYSTNSCPYCHMAKEYLKQKGINYREVDVARDKRAAMEMVSHTGQTGVPQININGHWIIGFDKYKIDELLSD